MNQQTPPPTGSRHPRDGYKPNPTWLTSAEAAAKLGVQPRTLNKWRHATNKTRRGPEYIKWDGYWVFYTPEAITAYLRKRGKVVPGQDSAGSE